MRKLAFLIPVLLLFYGCSSGVEEQEEPVKQEKKQDSAKSSQAKKKDSHASKEKKKPKKVKKKKAPQNNDKKLAKKEKSGEQGNKGKGNKKKLKNHKGHNNKNQDKDEKSSFEKLTGVLSDSSKALIQGVGSAASAIGEGAKAIGKGAGDLAGKVGGVASDLYGSVESIATEAISAMGLLGESSADEPLRILHIQHFAFGFGEHLQASLQTNQQNPIQEFEDGSIAVLIQNSKTFYQLLDTVRFKDSAPSRFEIPKDFFSKNALVIVGAKNHMSLYGAKVAAAALGKNIKVNLVIKQDHKNCRVNTSSDGYLYHLVALPRKQGAVLNNFNGKKIEVSNYQVQSSCRRHFMAYSQVMHAKDIFPQYQDAFTQPLDAGKTGPMAYLFKEAWPRWEKFAEAECPSCLELGRPYAYPKAQARLVIQDKEFEGISPYARSRLYLMGIWQRDGFVYLDVERRIYWCKQKQKENRSILFATLDAKDLQPPFHNTRLLLPGPFIPDRHFGCLESKKTVKGKKSSKKAG